MENRNGFRRRTAVAVRSPKKYTQLSKPESTACSRETPKNRPVKFNKINDLRRALLHDHRRDQQFLKIVDEVRERKGTFFRMGFRSYEKKENRKVLGDVLGLDSNRTKGTMFLGELWSNREHTRFLKENRIYMTKVKLIDKFQNIRKDQKEAQKDISQLLIQDLQSSHSQGELRDPLASTMSCTKRMAQRKACAADNLEDIKSSLKQLKQDSSMQSLIGEVKSLQRCQERMDKVERHYFLKMLQLE